MGQYVAGQSHVCLTNSKARYTKGLSVNDFLRRKTVKHL
ncbi:histidinol dehydrogenase [Staphylococcus aureus]